MKMKGHSLRTLGVIGAAALGSVLSFSVGAASPSRGREVSVTPTRKLDPRDAAIVASAGTRVLVHIAEARGTIHEKDASRAREDLRAAEGLLNTIRSALPTATVKDRIRIARRHLEYEKAQQVLPDLAPIERELTLLRDFVPTEEARSHLDKAREHLKSGDKRAALEELKAVDAAVAYEEVDLPLSETEAHVSRALSELAIGDTEKADEVLQAAEKSVQTVVAVARGADIKGSTAAANKNAYAEGK